MNINTLEAGSDDSDNNVEWEDVIDSRNFDLQSPGAGKSIDIFLEGTSDTTASTKPIEIILTSGKKPATDKKTKNVANVERSIRIKCHKIHTVALLANATTRNKWLNDPLLRARLMSLTPMSIQNTFTIISRKSQPDAAKRGRLFEAAIMRLTQWWCETFETSNTGHIRSRTFSQIQNVIKDDAIEEESGEVIRSSKSLMKHALMKSGCRDTNAQLFTALCRALDIPARLVVSLQSVPWQAQVGKENTKKKGFRKSLKGKERATNMFENLEGVVSSEEAGTEDDMEEVDVPGTPINGSDGKASIFPGDGRTLSGNTFPSDKSNGKLSELPAIKLRKPKRQGQKLNSSSSTPRRQTPGPPLGGYPPVFWTEVFSRPDGRWIPVDPVRYVVNKRKVFEPPPHDKDNRMVYVVAIEEDGYARDVTLRYAKEYGAKTAKIQMGGKGRKEWWAFVMALMTRPFRLHRDDVEDEEFEVNQVIEGMPASVAGFKDHPLYVIERHLKRDEIIHPKIELGKFRGEPVYSRSNVVALKTSENWMRVGRKIKEGCHAMKLVKQRAVTVHRRRVIEMAQQDGEEMLQGLYSEAQTELYRPEPIIDGRVPKNDFGNIDLYVPSMLPQGASHVRHKRAAKISRELGFDYAEAVTSFEFRKGRAFPILTGVVVAAENEDALIEACLEYERNAEEKEKTKRMDRVLKKWSRLIQGLRIRHRLQQQYSNEQSTAVGSAKTEFYFDDANGPGGFLTEADAVVEPFHLPKMQHSAYAPFGSAGVASEISELKEKLEDRSTSTFPEITNDRNVEQVEIQTEENLQKFNNTPITMRELADFVQRKTKYGNNTEEPIKAAGVPSARRYYNGNTGGSGSQGTTSTRSNKRRRSVPLSSSNDDIMPSPSKKASKETAKEITSTRVLRPRAPRAAD